MVHRQLTARRGIGARLALTCGLAALVALAAATGAEAANRRIAISNYQWSNEEVQIDLGEHVTWYWTGPDTMHSVTGNAIESQGLDSDPGDDIPDHPVGDSFQLSFSAPGTYSFTCKLHNSVRGTITVSDVPGDPSSEPDPVPPNRVDLRAPRLRKLRLERSPVRGRGGQLQFDLGERARVEADYYGLERGRKDFAGWAKWTGYIGENEIRFGGRGKHFDAEPGRYVAELRAIDRSNNTSRPRRVRFQIAPPGRG